MTPIDNPEATEDTGNAVSGVDELRARAKDLRERADQEGNERFWMMHDEADALDTQADEMLLADLATPTEVLRSRAEELRQREAHLRDTADQSDEIGWISFSKVADAHNALADRFDQKATSRQSAN